MKSIPILILCFFVVSVVIFPLAGCSKSSGPQSPETETPAKETTEEAAQPAEGSLSGKSVLFVIAPENFRDEELSEPKRILEENGAKVTIVSTKKGVCRGMLGTEVTVEKTLEEINSENFNAVVFVGGSGAKELAEVKRAQEIAKEFYDSGKITAAICLAPLTLSNAGILEGKNVCAFQTITEELSRKGANVKSSGVRRDGNLITASGPEYAVQFGEKLLEALKE